MKGTFDGHGNVIRVGDQVKCCPGREGSRVPYTDRFFAGDLILGEVEWWPYPSGYVWVRGVETQGNWQPGDGFCLESEQVVVVKNGDVIGEFDLDSFNQMLGIGG